MFQFPALAPHKWWYTFSISGYPIRKSAHQRIFAPKRGLSQLITSFIASESQGIHRMPLLTFFIYHRFTSHISMSGTAAVNILMSFIALLFALLVQYVNDRFNCQLSIVNCQLNLWRITDSNRWPPACKAGALASWANPPLEWNLRLSRCSPRQSWTADLYIISVAL